MSFLTHDGSWTSEVSEALAFRRLADLAAYTEAASRSDVEVYFMVHDRHTSQWDYTIPILLVRMTWPALESPLTSQPKVA